MKAKLLEAPRPRKQSSGGRFSSPSSRTPLKKISGPSLSIDGSGVLQMQASPAEPGPAHLEDSCKIRRGIGMFAGLGA